MDNQSWGWFANIDDDSFVDFQVEEHSQKFTQQEELSEISSTLLLDHTIHWHTILLYFVF